jgi:hypothetical protein
VFRFLNFWYIKTYTFKYMNTHWRDIFYIEHITCSHLIHDTPFSISYILQCLPLTPLDLRLCFILFKWRNKSEALASPIIWNELIVLFFLCLYFVRIKYQHLNAIMVFTKNRGQLNDLLCWYRLFYYLHWHFGRWSRSQPLQFHEGNCSLVPANNGKSYSP